MTIMVNNQLLRKDMSLSSFPIENITSIVVSSQSMNTIKRSNNYLISSENSINDIIDMALSDYFVNEKELTFVLAYPNLLTSLISSLSTICLPYIHTFIFQGNFILYFNYLIGISYNTLISTFNPLFEFYNFASLKRIIISCLFFCLILIL